MKTGHTKVCSYEVSISALDLNRLDFPRLGGRRNYKLSRRWIANATNNKKIETIIISGIKLWIFCQAERLGWLAGWLLSEETTLNNVWSKTLNIWVAFQSYFCSSGSVAASFCHLLLADVINAAAAAATATTSRITTSLSVERLRACESSSRSEGLLARQCWLMVGSLKVTWGHTRRTLKKNQKKNTREE